MQNQIEEVKKILEKGRNCDQDRSAPSPPSIEENEPEMRFISDGDELTSIEVYWWGKKIKFVPEPKSSDDRLLTPEERLDIRKNVSLPTIQNGLGAVIFADDVASDIAKAQRDLTASIKDAEIVELRKQFIEYSESVPKLLQENADIVRAECQTRVERIFSKIEKHYGPPEGHPQAKDWGVAIWEDEWQELKKQEGVNEPTN